MKKKILFVSTRSPFSNIFSGDRYRAKLIIKYLSKKNNIDVLYSDYSKGIKKKKIKSFFFNINLLDKIKGIFNSLIFLKPLQLGYFYSSDVNNFVKKNHGKYETIIFHMIRSAQYLPIDFEGKKILEMTDLQSKNYNQVAKSFSIFNPLFYIYYLEKLFVQRYEKNCFKRFDKIIFVSKNDIKNRYNLAENKKIIEISNSFELNKNLYKFNKKNNKILFIGNIKYLPNKLACLDFTERIFPKINVIYPKIEFHIIGEIKKRDKKYLSSKKNVFCHGPIKKIDKIINRSLCGICNLNIATGIQNKILTYMSYGLPCISTQISYKNTILKKNKEILVYQNDNDLINFIKKLKTDKKFSNKISKLSYLAVKSKYSEKKVLSQYQKII